MREVEEIHAPTRTLIFLRRENPLVVNEALEAGADGVMFISSIGSHRGDFFKALQRTRDGSVYYPDAIRARPVNLSERELEVLRLLPQVRPIARFQTNCLSLRRRSKVMSAP